YLRLKDLRVLDKAGARTLLFISDARIGINIPHYLRTGRLERGSLKVAGTTLSLVRNPDGSFVFAGLEQHGAKEGFTDWLLNQDRLSLESSQVYWTDLQGDGRRMHFTDVNLSLRSNGRRHQVDGALRLAEARGRPLAIALDFNGDLTQPAQWSGRFFMQGIDLELERWFAMPARSDINLKEGRADFRVWGAWAQTKLQDLQGEMAIREMRFLNAQAAPLPTSLKGVSGRLRWQRQTQQDWLLDVTRLSFRHGEVVSAPGRMQIRSVENGQAAQLDMVFKSLVITDASSLLLVTGDALGTEMHEALQALQPRGELHELRLRLIMPNADQTAGRKFSMQTRLVDVTTRAWKNIPAAQNINALLRADERGGVLDIDSRLVKLEFPEMFRAPIMADTLSGRIRWLHTGQGWHIEATDVRAKNADINAGMNGAVDMPDDRTSPLLNIRIGFENGNAANIGGYLPINHLPPQALAWLDRSLLGGYVSSGSILIHGRAGEFPFKANQGSFETRFFVTNAALAYAEGWPRLENAAGIVVFRGPGLDIDATSGSIFNAEVVQIHVAIPDMTVHEPELLLQGKVRGSTTDALRFLKEGPLKKNFVKYVSGLSASGQSIIDLDLVVPLQRGQHHVKGTLALADSTLRFLDKAESRDIELRHVKGTVNFTEHGFTGKDIAATLLGQTLRLDVRTTAATQDAAKALQIDARGKITAAELIKQIKKSAPEARAGLLERIKGAADWSAALTFVEGADAATPAAVTVQSNLQGMEVNFPAPLGKSKDEALPLTIKTSFSNQPIKQYSVSYGARADAVLEVTQTDKRAEFKRGAVEFGESGKPVLPPTGLRISGSLPRLSVDAWNDILDARDKSKPSGIMKTLSEVDLRVGVLNVFKQDFNNARIEASKTSERWLLQVTSDQVAGTVTLPQTTDAAWVMDFERLHLAKPEAKNSRDSSLDPHSLPALRISSKSFKYGDLDLGQLTLESSRRPSGLHVDTFKVQTPALTATGQGDWENTGGRQTSRFDFEIESEELGKALTALGYTTNIAGGKTQIDLTANWNGTPMDVAFERLNGTLGMVIGKGRFLDIDPGAGRVFGLLSIQSLPRRLSLDFSDLFGKGFAFDSITGEFALKDGNAYTNNLLMKGPSAIITVTGRTGLAAKDYDQMVTVKPQIGASLPLAATIAGGPAVGAAVYLAQKIFQPQIDDLTGYQYTIKGSWKDPKIDRIETENIK
ncbi:MAG: YhdP family protein, partial [Gammaproteobacteria bacterium]